MVGEWWMSVHSIYVPAGYAHSCRSHYWNNDALADNGRPSVAIHRRRTMLMPPSIVYFRRVQCCFCFLLMHFGSAGINRDPQGYDDMVYEIGTQGIIFGEDIIGDLISARIVHTFIPKIRSVQYQLLEWIRQSHERGETKGGWGKGLRRVWWSGRQ